MTFCYIPERKSEIQPNLNSPAATFVKLTAPFDDKRNMRRFYLLLILFVATNSANAVELTHPSTAAIACSYDISEIQPRIGDTIQIVRTLVNNELFDLTGVYISDNLPESFQIL